MAKEFDLIVMGAGIIGAACALEASCNGLNVLLLDKGDFGGETSSGSFKIVHGGLRYLQHLDFPRLKESYQEQRFIRKSAPHLVKPLPFLVPCYGYGMKGREALRSACSMYEFLSRTRNDGVSEELKLPDHKVLSKDEVLKIAPLLQKKGLRGGVVFYDCQMLNPDRLTLAVVQAAKRNGVVVKNYNEVVKITTRFGSQDSICIDEILVRDKISSFEYRVKSHAYVNAMGPYCNQIGRLFDESNLFSNIDMPIYSKGVQLVFPKIVDQYALSVQGKGIDTASTVSRGGRAFFMQPWRGHTLVGTTDTIFQGEPKDFKITLSEIKAFLAELSEAYPSDIFSPINVKYAFGGLRSIDPAIRKQIEDGTDRDGMVNTSRDEDIIDHSKVMWAGLKKIENLVSVVGIKYTTFRSVGERVISKLF